MENHLLHITAWIGLLLLATVLVSLRSAHIRVEYSVTWLVAAATIFVLSVWRGLLDALSRLLGLPQSPLTLFLLSGAVLLLVAFRFSMIVSKLRDDNIALAQRVAILEHYLNASQPGENAGA